MDIILDAIVMGDVNFGFGKVQRFHQKHKVWGWVNLVGTPLKNFIQDAEIGGDLGLFNTKLKRFHQKYKVGGRIFLPSGFQLTEEF